MHVYGNIRGNIIFDGLRSGDTTAKKVVNAYTRYLAEGIANIVNAFRPEAILLGGGISREGETLINLLKMKVKRLLFGDLRYAPVKIKTVSLGNNAGMVGAAMLAKEKV